LPWAEFIKSGAMRGEQSGAQASADNR